jgi:anion-transporting  ArsA/GET3 family ATPase
MSLEEVLEDKEICICAGAGGVGKTSASAAIALGMAAAGRKVGLLTIDPAQRLAGSLGVEQLSNAEHKIEAERFSEAGLEVRGELWAMMLDAKRTFDDLVDKYAPDENARKAVLSNRIYRELSSAVAGSQEYMAIEKLYELYHSGQYDLLVLDTPPSRHALQFLDAPERLSRFLDSRSLKLFLEPGRMGLRLFGRGTSLLFSMLRRITGVDLLEDLSSFFQSFDDMAEGFRDRAHKVAEILGEESTTFFVVTSPQRGPIQEALYFRDKLAEAEMPFGAMIVNRTHSLPGADGADESAIADWTGPELAASLAGALEDYLVLAQRDRENIASLRDLLGTEPLIEIPYLEDDIHDIAGLVEMNTYLFSAQPNKSH